MSYSVTLADGQVLNNLSLNGNNFIANYPITEDIFQFNLATVTITNNDPSDDDFPMVEMGVHENMQLVQITHEEGSDEWWFVIIDIPESEMRHADIMAKLDYLAMMTDVEFY